jgi:hypothetical protein
VGSVYKHFVFASDFLFARPSWVSGIARAFDFWGLFDSYNISPTPKAADIRATVSDWWMVGQDLSTAIAEFDSEQRESRGRQGQLFPRAAHPA